VARLSASLPESLGKIALDAVDVASPAFTIFDQILVGYV
jgi:hypothetical protein